MSSACMSSADARRTRQEERIVGQVIARDGGASDPQGAGGGGSAASVAENPMPVAVKAKRRNRIEPAPKPAQADGMTATAASALAAMAAAGFLGAAAHGDLVAAWNMNGVNPTLALEFASTHGRGTVDFTGLGSGSSALAGTLLGAQPGESAGDALAVSGSAFNGASMRIDCDTRGFTNLSFAFAVRRSSTGFVSNRIEYWTTLGWETLGSFGASSTSWEIRTFDLSALDGLEDGSARLRISVDGATGTTGSIRFDNFSMSGSAIPAPGAVALLAIAGLVGRRRRRRSA